MKTQKKVTQEIPDFVNKEIFKEWTDGGEIVSQQNNGHNYCVMVKFSDPDLDERFDIYQYQRYFNLSEQTHVSVDWDSSQVGMLQKVTQLLNNYFAN